VKLCVEGDQLRYSAPKGVVTPGLLAELRAYKTKLIALLSEPGGAPLAIRAEQGLVTGPLPLTPNQALSFATHDPDRHIWNLGLLFEAAQPLTPTELTRIVSALLAHHDALRTCAVQHADGWHQFIAPPAPTPPVSLVDLSALPAPAQGPTLTSVAGALQRGFQLDKGPLLRVAAFDCGPEVPSRLLILIHHTACDYYSAAILWQDFLTALAQLRHGQPIRLPPKTTSISYYAERMQTYTQAGGLAAELDYWLAPTRQQAAPLPKDFPAGVHTGASARTISEALSRAETDALQQCATDDTQLLALILAALGRTCARWAGSSALLVDLEYHGRVTRFDEVDLSRTVGWINYLFPLLLDLRAAAEPARLLQTVKAQLRALPNHGSGYGMLRYLCDDPAVAARFDALPQAPILLNYRGIQSQQLWAETHAFRPTRHAIGLPHSLEVVRPHLFIIEIDILEHRLWLHWTYSEQVHRAQTVQQLVQEFLAALRAGPGTTQP
jgi:non-ribosomal peptide synthase protein (TIGR01720 family)